MRVDDMRPCVLQFAHNMERVLRQNDHKGGWEHCSLSWLAARLIQEAGELLEELEGGINEEKVSREAADVANFAMMIWHKCQLERKI